MLELIVIFLVSLLAAVTAIWLYRKLSSREESGQSLVGRSGKPVRSKMAVQQGFISMSSTRRERVKSVKPRRTKGGTKAPWGW